MSNLKDYFKEDQIESADGAGGSLYVIVSKNDVNPIDLLNYLSKGFGVIIHDYEYDLDGEYNIYEDSWIITEDAEIVIFDSASAGR